MATVACRVTFLLMTLTLLSKVFANEMNTDPKLGAYGEEELTEIIPYMTDDKYIRHIHSMIKAYRDDIVGRRMAVETNAPADTKYKTWKRNSDLINSILALPKGLIDAGR